MRPIVLTAGPYAAGSVAGLAASQAPVSGTPLTLTGTAIDTPRRLVLTAGADAVLTRTFTLVGTGWSGNSIVEVMTVPSGAGAVISALDYKTLISATPTGTGWSANVSLGTSVTSTNNPMGSSVWARLDDYGFGPVNAVFEPIGTVTATVQYSDDDPNLVAPQTPVAPGSMTWVNDATIAASGTAAMLQLSAKPLWVRLTLNSGTAATGAAVLVVSQAGGKGG